jgi:hypothetical protein
MVFKFFWRTSLVFTAGLQLSSSTAFALLKFNEGRDKIFVTGTMAVGYDSNIFAAANAEGDTITTSTLMLEYLRNAGMIGVNGQLSWTRGDFTSNASESFSDPTLNLELVKDSGRTTGSATLSASRQSKADAVVNQRTVSWNYNAGLNWKYPVIDRYNVAGSFGFGLLDYTDSSSNYADLTTQSASVDLFYSYTSERDLVAGYRIRQSDTSANNQSIDHAFTAGVSGKILSKLKGNARIGYQIREEGASGQTFGSTTATVSATWGVSKRLTITGTVGKDFSTTATESSVDNLTFNLDAQYAIRNHWSIYSGFGSGYSDFLNGTDAGRSDYYMTGSAGISYTLNEHFRASLTYSYFQNWSNQSTSSFNRNTITLSLSSRW